MLRKALTMLAVVIIFGLTSLFQPLSFSQRLVQQGSSCRTFVETGKTVCDKFLKYWQEHGALEQFGYPISNPFRELSESDGKEYTVQYFQRAVLELHPENRPPYDVLLQLLGTYRFTSKYPHGEPESESVEDLPIYPNAQNVNVTHIDFAVPDQDVINITTFETKDKPDAVVAFYTEVLQKNGWLLDVQRGVEYLDFVHVAGPENPAYGLVIEIKVSGGKTQVKMSLDKTLPK